MTLPELVARSPGEAEPILHLTVYARQDGSQNPVYAGGCTAGARARVASIRHLEFWVEPPRPFRRQWHLVLRSLDAPLHLPALLLLGSETRTPLDARDREQTVELFRVPAGIHLKHPRQAIRLPFTMPLGLRFVGARYVNLFQE